MKKTELQIEYERQNAEREAKMNKILTEEEQKEVRDLAYDGMSAKEIIIMLDLDTYEHSNSFYKAFSKGRFEGKAELKRIYFEQARKGNLRNADKIFNKYN